MAYRPTDADLSALRAAPKAAPMQHASFHRGILAALWHVTAHDHGTMHAEIVDMAGLRNLLSVIEDEADAEMAGLLKYDHCQAATRRHLRTTAARGVEPCYRDGCPNATTTPRGYGECFCSAECADAAFGAKD